MSMTRIASVQDVGPGLVPLKRGFTLVEILVAVAVMSIVLVVIVSIMNSASILTGASHKRMDADSQARMVFDRMAADFGRIVNRGDVDYQFNKLTGNDAAYFYSEAPATAASSTGTSNSSVALVGYRINSSYQLERLGDGLLWGPIVPQTNPATGMVFLSYTGGTPDATSTINGVNAAGGGAFSSVISTSSNFQLLGEDVFRLEFCFLLKSYIKSDGTVSPAYYSNLPYNSRLTTATPAGPGHTSIYNGVGLSDVQAVVVTLALLDANSRKILPASNWTQVVNQLADPTDSDLIATPTVLPARKWQQVIDAGGLATAAGIPQLAAGQVRIYQRMFTLLPNNL